VRSAVAIAVAAAFVAPLGSLLVGSFRPEGLPPPRTIELPSEPTLANYGRLGDLDSFWRSFGTSAWVAAVAVPASILVASWAGFAAARLPRKGALVVVAGAILALSVPATALAVGRAVVYRELGLSGGPWPLLAPSLLGTTPIAVLVFAWRYRTLPPSVYDLARETGLSPVATWWRVVVPLTRSTTAGLAALVFVATWGNVLDPLFFVPDPRWATLPLAVRSLAALPAPSQPVMLAGAVVATAPAIAVVWVLLRRAASGFGRER
jgi:multiple sugar transport system permease protein